MSSQFSSDLPANRVRLALRFGWSLAEVYGRLTQSPLWIRTSVESPRLFISHLNPTSGEFLWVETQRLLHLAGQLFGEQEALAKPMTILDLPQTMEKLIQEESRSLPSVKSLYKELNHWSRQCWARLDAEDALLSEAASLGASLADTYWHMRLPFEEPAEASHGEAWDEMLKSRRLINMIRAVRRVEPYLPQGFGRRLRHSLWEWDITEDLIRTPEGELQIAYPALYALRSWKWVRKLRRRWMKKQELNPPELTRKERKSFWNQLRNQMLIWKRLLFDRTVRQLMRPSDWRWVRWTSRILYGLAAILLAAGGTVGFFYLVKVGQGLLTRLLPQIKPPAEFQDWLALGSAVVAVLGFLFTQVRQGAQGFVRLYQGIYTEVLAYRMDQRTLRAWNTQDKPQLLIVLQRLMRAEDL